MASSRPLEPRRRKGPGALELLEADHRRIGRLLHGFTGCRSAARRKKVVGQIVAALDLHLRLEAEVLHPAFAAAGGERCIFREAQAAHTYLRQMLEQIRTRGFDDPHLAARICVLDQAFRQSVRTEEAAGGMFDLARGNGMALDVLGRRIRVRKWQLLVGTRPRRARPARGLSRPLPSRAPVHGPGAQQAVRAASP